MPVLSDAPTLLRRNVRVLMNCRPIVPFLEAVLRIRVKAARAFLQAAFHRLMIWI
jgi:hypothetical protein